MLASMPTLYVVVSAEEQGYVVPTSLFAHMYVRSIRRSSTAPRVSSNILSLFAALHTSSKIVVRCLQESSIY
jgi:hypothetical protein